MSSSAAFATLKSVSSRWERAAGSISGDLLRVHRALPIRHQHGRAAGDLQIRVAAEFEVDDRAHLASAGRDCEELLVARILGGEVDGGAVGSGGEARNRSIEAVGQEYGLAWVGPGESGEAAEAVETLILVLVESVKSLAVGTEDGLGVACGARGQDDRFAAGHRRAIEMSGRFRVGSGIPVCGRREDHGLAVRRPGCRQRLGLRPQAASEALFGGEPGARKQVLRRPARFERLNEQMGLRVLEPLVPMADREAVVDAGLVFAGLLLGVEFLVVLFGQRAGEGAAGEQQPFAVGTDLRIGRAEGQGGKTDRLAAGCQVE